MYEVARRAQPLVSRIYRTARGARVLQAIVVIIIIIIITQAAIPVLLPQNSRDKT